MKTRLIIAIILHIVALFILWHNYGGWLVLAIYITITANNIEQFGRIMEEVRKVISERK